MTNGQINSTELVAALICKKDSFVEGIRYVQSVVEGSMTLLLLTENGIYAARDLLGRTPVVIGKKENAVFPLKALHISTLDTQITKSWDLGKSST